MCLNTMGVQYSVDLRSVFVLVAYRAVVGRLVLRRLPIRKAIYINSSIALSRPSRMDGNAIHSSGTSVEGTGGSAETDMGSPLRDVLV